MNKFCRLLAPALETYACATGHGDPALDESVVTELLADDGENGYGPSGDFNSAWLGQ
jgi:hypothetical protein